MVLGQCRGKQFGQLFIAFLLQVFVVEPFAFFVVKSGTALAASFEREEFYQFVYREYLFIVAGVPAQQGEEVDDGFGQIAGFAITRRYLSAFGVVPFEREDGEAEAVAVAFAQFAVALGFEQEGQMGKSGHGLFPAEGAVEQHVERSRGQPLFAADYMAHLHEVVVDDIGQVVGGQVVGRLVEYLVVEYR